LPYAGRTPSSSHPRRFASPLLVPVVCALAGLVPGVVLLATGGAHAGAPRKGILVVQDGWGSPDGFQVTGRVLEDRGASSTPPTANASRLANIAATLDAFESDEVRGVDVAVHVGLATFSATTDADGVFTVVARGLAPAQALPAGAVPVDVELMAADWTAPRATAFIHVVDGAGIALVSDIDDTVVKTYVIDKARMAATVLGRNARQLEPVVGAAENYVAARDKGVDVFFYLSGSPQNLHGRLRTFLDDHDFPRGPLLLKNLGEDKLFAHDDYKLGRLQMLATTFPQLRFVLVGDSGERDPEIYRAFARKHPDRVVAMVIRNVPGSGAAGPARMDGFTVVDDVYPTAQTIARLVPPRNPPRLPTARSSPPD
jgi:phosphatidate phosphatase APP1